MQPLHGQSWAAAVAGLGDWPGLGLAGEFTQARVEGLGRRLVSAEQQVNIDVAIAFNDDTSDRLIEDRRDHQIRGGAAQPLLVGGARIAVPVLAPYAGILERSAPTHPRP